MKTKERILFLLDKYSQPKQNNRYNYSQKINSYHLQTDLDDFIFSTTELVV